jgi:hypothetical protein
MRAHAGARPTDQAIISAVRHAVAAVYGDAEGLSDADLLGLFRRFAPKDGRPVRNPGGYMAKIFADTPDLDTLLGLIDVPAHPPPGQLYLCARCGSAHTSSDPCRVASPFAV